MKQAFKLYKSVWQRNTTSVFLVNAHWPASNELKWDEIKIFTRRSIKMLYSAHNIINGLGEKPRKYNDTGMTKM